MIKDDEDETLTKNKHRNNPTSKKKDYAVCTEWACEIEESALRLESLRHSETYLSERSNGCNECMTDCFCSCSRKIGGMFSLLERSDGSPILIVGPYWSFCVFVTVPLIVLGSVASFLVLLDKGVDVPIWVTGLYLLLLLITLSSLFCSGCRNPGLLERVTDEEAAVNDGWFWSEQVGSFRPSGARYCKEAKVMVKEYHHICPWIGTSIGEGNKNAFYVFLVSSNLLCYISVGIMLYFFIYEEI